MIPFGERVLTPAQRNQAAAAKRIAARATVEPPAPRVPRLPTSKPYRGA